MKKEFYSNGKLLLSGEYVVLDGAEALALPTKFGQSLTVETTKNKIIAWESYDDNGDLWFKIEWAQKNGRLLTIRLAEGDSELEATLTEILETALEINPNFLEDSKGYSIKTQLDFPRAWGLGTSSTLINNIAQWATIDAFALLEKSFGGSGYDIAAAQHNSPIVYARRLKSIPEIKGVDLDWDFTDRLFFVYLNKKQDSKQGISMYRNASAENKIDISLFSNYTQQLIAATNLDEFIAVIEKHEQDISKIIDTPPIKQRLFPDYKGCIKSLGAWGGDFLLVTGAKKDLNYFKEKGFSTIIPYAEMIL